MTMCILVGLWGGEALYLWCHLAVSAGPEGYVLDAGR